MRFAVLCSLLLSACILAPNYRTYALTWTCLSPEGCERAESVELINRAEIITGDDVVEFSSNRDGAFLEYAQLVPSDELPAGCFWLYDLSIFALELEPGRFCRTSGALELELTIPNRDAAAHSHWLVQGREIDP